MADDPYSFNAPTRFSVGNQLWRFSNPLMKLPVFEDGQELYEKLIEYFEWAQANPIEADTVGWYQGEANHETIAHPRALTIAGFCAFAGFDRQNWAVWKTKRPDLRPVQEWAEQIMFEQKFTGAAVGLFNANLIARDLGLADVTDHRSGDGSMTPKPTVIEFVAPELTPPEGPTEEPVNADGDG